MLKHFYVDLKQIAKYLEILCSARSLVAVKSKTNWLEIRSEWEASPLEGYAWLATKYGVDKSNLKKRMDKEQVVKKYH